MVKNKMPDNTSLISSQGTIHIPKSLRVSLGFNTGLRVHWYELGDLLVVSKIKLEDTEKEVDKYLEEYS